MLLRDATQRAAVDLFLRTLDFPFPARDIVGIPGGLVGLPDPLGEEELVLLLHELEHLTALTYPLGTFFTGLGLRVLDLHNAMARSARDFIHDTPDPSEWGKIAGASKVTLAAGQAAEFTQLVITTAELLTPLLEGLAMMSELELSFRDRPDASNAWHVAVALEAAYYDHRARVLGGSVWTDIQKPEEWHRMFEDLTRLFYAQVERSRALRLAGDWIDGVFWPPGEEPLGEEVLPYFLGHLFLKRLRQQWQVHLPEMTSEDFFYLATQLACSVFPISLLAAYSLADHAGRAMSPLLPSLLEELLKGALALSAEDLRLLASPPSFLRWEWEACRLAPLRPAADQAGPGGGDAQYDQVLREVLWSVFDLRDPADPALGETATLLRALDECKFLCATAQRPVAVVGIDPEEHALLLMDVGRVEDGTAHGSSYAIPAPGVTYFPFAPEQEQQLLEGLGGSGRSLPPLRLGDAPYRVGISAETPLARLATFCHFWPQGVPHLDAGREVAPGPPVELVRVLILGDRRAFVSRSADPTLPRLLQTRAKAGTLLKGIRGALAPHGGGARRVLEDLCALFDAESPATAFATAALDQVRKADESAVRARCRAAYQRLLFPELRTEAEATLRSHKLKILEPALDAATQRQLRSWLQGGLLFGALGAAAGAGEEPRRAAQAAVETVRRASREILGCPLVAWREPGGHIVLDLLP